MRERLARQLVQPSHDLQTSTIHGEHPILLHHTHHFAAYRRRRDRIAGSGGGPRSQGDRGAVGEAAYDASAQPESLARAESLASVTVIGRPAFCSPITGVF
jgi:hypothetical protein